MAAPRFALALALALCFTAAAPVAQAQGATTELFTLAAGCFWSVEMVFQGAPGVVSTRVGYAGGSKASPSYEEVTTGRTGHTEAVEVTFDPSVVTYEELLQLFWAIHDPTDARCQGNDCGTQYRTAIFYHSEEQKQKIDASIAAHEAKRKDGKKVATELLATPPAKFWVGEDYHQQYLELRGQDASKGSLAPIQCYGDRGPIKKMDKPSIKAILLKKGEEL